MSREVDSRVVEMQFDNANFEKNTKQTISTIDRLMEKLRFKGAEKGFEKLDEAAGEVDFGQMSRSLDTLESKFSTLNVVATTALVNITNKVIDTGEKLVKSLSVDQVISGWNKYTEKTANVQTIMNATGDSIDTVNGYLNKLMWYSDETSFSFSEMTSALSQMTASGGNIKKMIPMIMGIANATADAGKSGFAFQSTIRNITQSYSAGYLQLQDWKSLNLMGTATKALKQELIDTAVELGTIKKGDVTIASFESSLSKKWANTKVMEKTFEKYASMMEAAYEMTQKDKSLTTSEALEKLTGQYGELAERSALAAQQAKSFGEAIDSTKDAVSSKWMKTFELIFGNKEEATGTWTELANRLYDIFVPPIEAMNDRFAEGLDSGWQQLHDKMGDQADTYSAVLEKVALANGIVTEESIEKAGSFGAALKESGASAELLQNGLDSTILTLKDYLAMSDKELNARNVDRDLVQKEYDALCKLSEEFRTGKASMDDFANAINRTSGREHLMQSLWNIMDAIGKVVTPIKEAFHEIFPAADGDRIYSFAERLDLLTKKLIISDETAEKIKTTFKGVFSVLKVGVTAVTTVVKTAAKAFGTLTEFLKPVGNAALNVAAGLGDCMTRISEIVTGSGTIKSKIADVGSAVKQLVAPVGDLFSMLKSGNLTGTLSDWLKSLAENGNQNVAWLNSLSEKAQSVLRPMLGLLEQAAAGGLTFLGVLGAVASGVLSKLGETADFVKSWVKGQLEGADSLETTLTSLPKKIGDAVSTFAGSFKTSLSTIETSAGDVFRPVTNFFNALKEGFDAISGTDIYRFLSLVDVGLLAFTIGQLAKATKSFSSIVNDLFKGPLTQAIDAMKGSFNTLTGALKSWTKNNNSKILLNIGGAMLMFAGSMAILSNLVDPEKFMMIATTLMTFGVLLVAAVKLLEPSTTKFAKIMDNLKSQALNAASLWGAAAALVGLAVAVKSVLTGVKNLLEVMQNGDMGEQTMGLIMIISTLGAALLGFWASIKAIVVDGKSIRPKTLVSLGAAMVSFGVSLKLMGSAIAGIAKLKDWENVTVATTMMMGSMAAFAAAMKKWGSFNFQNGAGFAALGAGMLELAGACKIIAGIDTDSLYNGIGAIEIVLVEFAVIGATAKMGLKTGAAFMAVASSVMVLVSAMALLGAIPVKNLMNGFAAIEACLWPLYAVVGLLSGADAANATAGATAMLTISGALLTLSGAVAVFAYMGDGAWGALAKCAAAVAGLGLAVAGLSLLKGDALQAAWTINTLSGGLMKIAAACAIFTVVDWGAIATAGLTLSGLIAILMLAGLAASQFPLLETGLKVLASAFDTFASGALKLTGAIAILGLLSTVARPLCEAIVDAKSDIQAALIAVVDLLCETIINCAEPLTNAFIAVESIICNSIIQTAPMISQTFRVVIESIFSEIGQMIVDLLNTGISWFGEMFEDDRLLGMIVNAVKWIGTSIINAFKSIMGIASPSKVMAENGRYVVEGLIEGLKDGSVLAKATNAILGVAASIRNAFCNFWGIHSPSEYMAELAEYIPEGAAIGIENGTSDVTDAVDKQSTEVQRHYSDYRNNLIQQNQEAVSGVRNVLETGFTDIGAMAKTKGAEALQNFANGMTDGMSQMFGKSKWLNSDIANNLLENAKSLLGGDMSWFEPMFAKTNDDAANVASTATGKTGSKSKASKTGKTLADTLSEAYSKQLKANKAKKDAASGEYALWEVTDGDTASVEELIRQKTESLTKEIELQTERVAIAKEQYDTLLSKVGAEDDKTKDAYSTMLSEQKTLAELQRDKQDSIFKVIQERYESDSKTAQDEYNLWSALYEDSAAVTEKSNKKIEYINKKISVQAEILTAAEQDYTETKKKFGEASAATQAAYRQYLEEKTSQQELINELNKAQIEAFDNEVSYLEKQEKLITNRQSMLAKIYGDGSLADREEAYKEAVEKYGEDSLEARRASATGTMTAIIGVGTALDSMSYSLRKVTNKQLKYDEAVKKFGKNSETALDALADLQDEQYSFVGFAEDLADAFDMDDTGKQITMQLGYSISKNWKPIQDGFNSVWDQVKVSFPDAANRLASAFGVATKDGFGTVATDLFATIKAIAIGDWGSAISGGLATALDFVGSEFGQSVLSTVGNALYQLPEAFGKLAEGGGTVKVLGQLTQVKGTTEGLGSIVRNLTGLVGNASSGTGLVGKAVQGLGKIGGMIGGSGGLLGGLGELGGTLVSVLGSIGPEGWLIGAAVAGGGLLIANWDKVSDFFSDFFDWLGNAFSSLWDWISNGFKGLVDVGGDLISGLWNGITGAAGAIWNGVTSFCGGILDGICDFFGIHSPSTVMAEVGQYLSLGLAQGITGSADDVTSSMEELSRNTLSTMEAVVDRVSSVAAEDFDYEPTIRPVMDMTDVQNGADWLNGNLFRESSMALNADRTAGLAANVVRRAEAERNAASMEPTDNTDTMTTKDIVESVEALGEHVDNIAYAVSQMKMSIDGRKFVGGIISEVDEQLGRIAKRR